MSLKSEWMFRRRTAWITQAPYSLTGLCVAYFAISLIGYHLYGRDASFFEALAVVIRWIFFPLVPWLIPAVLIDYFCWPYFGRRDE